MTKTMSAVALALLLGAAPMAYAQTAQHPMNAKNQAANANEPVQTIQPDQIRASKMIGSTAYDGQNRNIAKVRDLVLDRDGKIAAAVVDVGTFLGMRGKGVGVKLSDLKTDNNRSTLDRTKE